MEKNHTAGQSTGDNMPHAHCMQDAYSESIIPTDFARLQWLHERAPMLHYMYIVFCVKFDVTCLKFLIVPDKDCWNHFLHTFVCYRI